MMPRHLQNLLRAAQAASAEFERVRIWAFSHYDRDVAHRRQALAQAADTRAWNKYRLAYNEAVNASKR